MLSGAFILTAVVILVTPGPTNTLLAASGAAMGLRNAWHLAFAEAIGYACAIGFFLVLTEQLQDWPAAVSAMKVLAASWLVFSAVRLWRTPVVPDLPDRRGAFWQVLGTTLLNPKAMLVALVAIPGLMPGNRELALISFVGLSTLAGLCWILLGSAVPPRLRGYSYKAASMVLFGFSVAAAASALHV